MDQPETRLTCYISSLWFGLAPGQGMSLIFTFPMSFWVVLGLLALVLKGDQKTGHAPGSLERYVPGSGGLGQPIQKLQPTGRVFLPPLARTWAAMSLKKESFTRGSILFPPKVAKRPPCQARVPHLRGMLRTGGSVKSSF